MKRFLMLCAATTLPLAAGGCAVGARPADVGLPSRFEAPAAQAQAAAEELDRWWLLYDDAQLTALVDEALRASPDGRAAAARLDQARALRQEQLASTWPQGQLVGSATRQTIRPLEGGGAAAAGPAAGGGFMIDGESYALNFNVSWELDLFGRVAAARRVVSADYRAAEFVYAGARASLAANVADGLFQARGLAMQLEEAREALRIQAELERVVRARAERGMVPGSDLAQAEAELASARARLEDAEAQATVSKRALLLLLGRADEGLASLAVEPALGPAPAAPAIVPGDLLARRPDVRQAEQALISADSALSVRARSLFPTLTLQPGAGLSQIGASSANAVALWSIGAGLTVPVLNQPRLLAQMRGQRAVAEQAVIGYERAVQTAYAEAENALVQAAADRRRVELLRAAEQSAARAYEAKRTGYARGFVDLQGALIAESTWRQSRQALIAAEIALMRRSVQLFKALGGGWTPAPRQGPSARTLDRAASDANTSS